MGTPLTKRTLEDCSRLESIRIKLENVPPEKRNAITDDIEWLIKELREAWLREENKI